MFLKGHEIAQDVASELVGDGEFGMFCDEGIIPEPEKPSFLNRSLLWQKNPRQLFARLRQVGQVMIVVGEFGDTMNDLDQISQQDKTVVGQM